MGRTTHDAELTPNGLWITTEDGPTFLTNRQLSDDVRDLMP